VPVLFPIFLLAFVALIVLVLFAAAQAPATTEAGPRLAPAPDAEATAWVDKTLAGLSLEKKIAQFVTADKIGRAHV
jgi:hypothetical protein